MQGGGGRRCGASLTDDNAADGNLDKQNVQVISEQCLSNIQQRLKSDVRRNRGDGNDSGRPAEINPPADRL